MGIDAEMLVKLQGHWPDEDELRKAGHHLFNLFGPERLYVNADEQLLMHGTFPELGGVVRVNTLGRFYGPGYERGDFPLLRMLAEALEYIFRKHSPEVYYGGDDGRVALFDCPAREKLTQYWLEHGGAPYYRGPTGFNDDPYPPTCLRCQIPMAQNGWGARLRFRCECGDQVERQGGRETRTTYCSRISGA